MCRYLTTTLFITEKSLRSLVSIISLRYSSKSHENLFSNNFLRRYLASASINTRFSIYLISLFFYKLNSQNIRYAFHFWLGLLKQRTKKKEETFYRLHQVLFLKQVGKPTLRKRLNSLRNVICHLIPGI